MAALARLKILKEGYLKYKEAGSSLASWKSRYAILQLNDRSGCLQFTIYKEMPAISAYLLKQILLTEDNYGGLETKSKSGKHVFSLITLDATECFAVDSLSEMQQWVKPLQNYMGIEVVMDITIPMQQRMLKKGKAQLRIRAKDAVFVITTNDSPPRCLGIWRLGHIKTFATGTIRMKQIFRFETGSRCPSGQRTYIFQASDVSAIERLFQDISHSKSLTSTHQKGDTLDQNLAAKEMELEHPAQKPTPAMPHEYEYMEHNQEDTDQEDTDHYDYPDMVQRGDAKQDGRLSAHGGHSCVTNTNYEAVEFGGIYEFPAYDESSLYAQFRKFQIPVIPRHTLKVIDLLGSGQFGTVSKAVWHSPFGPLDVAVKTLLPNASEEDKVKFLQEAAIMGQFQHPNVIKLRCVITGEPKMIVLELLSKGDMKSYLKSLRPETDAKVSHRLLNYCRQIASGMAYLSSKGFIHRDLAARNVLLSSDDVCKIGDFGLSRDLADESYYFSHGGKIPVKWTAPEALNFLKYSTASDVWSYGMVMYEIWSLGRQPYKDYTNQKIMELVNTGFRLPPPPGCPRSIYQQMIECWHPQASERPTFHTILSFLSHPDTELLQIDAAVINPDALKLGASILTAAELYKDLQETYSKM